MGRRPTTLRRVLAALALTVPTLAVPTLAVPTLALSALLTAAPAAGAAASTTDGPLSCTDLETPEVVATATSFSSQPLVPIEGDDLFLPAPERDDFLERGGQYCAWIAAASPLHVAYSPITDADADLQMASLEAAGLTREEQGDEVSYELKDVPGFTVPDVFGRFLFADGYWYLVKYTSTGSGGTTVLDVEPALIESIRDVVETGLGPSSALAPEPAPLEPEPEAAPEPGVAPLDPTPGPSASDRTDPDAPFTVDDPSVLSGLPTAAEVIGDPRRLAGAALGGLVLTALVALPTALLNNSLTEGYDRLRDRVRRALARFARPASRTRRRLTDATAIAIGLPAAALISVFVDPRAGLTDGTARLFASTLAGFAVESLALLAVVAWLLRRRGADARVRMRLGSLLILALAVVLTRVTGFEPGFLFGVVIAVAFTAAPTPDDELTAARLEVRLLALLSLVGWLGYSALYPFAAGGEPLLLLVGESLAAVVLGGLTALLVLLVPAGETPGAILFRARKLRWGAAFAGTVIAFCAIVLPLPESWETVSAPFVLWVALFVGYSLLAVAVWAVVTFVRAGADAARRP